MTLLPQKPDAIPSPFLIVCEGHGDAKFLDKLIAVNKIENCTVACPSDDFIKDIEGASKLHRYLTGIRFIEKKNSEALRGLMVVVDEDGKPDKQFSMACDAMEYGGYAKPSKAFAIEEVDGFRVAIFIIPGENKEGTLENLLMEATIRKTPEVEKCIDEFVTCVGVISSCSANQQAKMRLSALIGASCKHNPWAPPALIWSDDCNPVPIESDCYTPIIDFVREFVRGLGEAGVTG